MKRILLQGYIKNCVRAVEMYKRAFGAKVVSEYMEDDVYIHVELEIDGTIVSLSESSSDVITGNGMQFCFHYLEDEKDKIITAYEVLKEGSEIIHDLGPTFYSDLMVDFVDVFGIHWCLFV